MKAFSIAMLVAALANVVYGAVTVKIENPTTMVISGAKGKWPKKSNRYLAHSAVPPSDPKNWVLQGDIKVVAGVHAPQEPPKTSLETGDFQFTLKVPRTGALNRALTMGTMGNKWRNYYFVDANGGKVNFKRGSAPNKLEEKEQQSYTPTEFASKIANGEVVIHFYHGKVGFMGKELTVLQGSHSEPVIASQQLHRSKICLFDPAGGEPKCNYRPEGGPDEYANAGGRAMEGYANVYARDEAEDYARYQKAATNLKRAKRAFYLAQRLLDDATIAQY